MRSQEIQSALCRSRRGKEIYIENLLIRTRLASSITPAFLTATLAVWLGFLMNGSLKLPGTYPPGILLSARYEARGFEYKLERVKLSVDTYSAGRNNMIFKRVARATTIPTDTVIHSGISIVTWICTREC